MDSNDIKSMKLAYCNQLISEGYTDKATSIESKDIFTPVYDPLYLHPEQELDPIVLNNSFNDIVCDLNIVNTELCKAAANIKSLMQDINTQLQNAEDLILTEKENQQDLNILCNINNGFDLVVPLTASDFSGAFSVDNDKVFYMNSNNFNNVNISVVSVSGNGYEGNKYVYNNGIFQQSVIDTSNKAFINDGSTITVYEYSRITANSSELNVPPEVNFDSIEATCSIILNAVTPINMIRLISSSNNLVLLSVETSSDGVVFTQQNLQTLDIKTQNKQYDVNNYIPDSGIICFPDTQYVKLVLQSSGYTTDTIAFNKTIMQN